MKKTTITLLFILFSIGIQAQFSIHYSVGYASYKMDDLKEVVETTFKNGLAYGGYPGHTALVDNFPSYITHHLNVGYQHREHEFGVNLSYLTTGSKLAAADYSGYFYEKLIVNGYRLGLFYRNYFSTINIKMQSLSFFVELSPAINFSNLKSKGKLSVMGDDGKEYIDKSDESINKTAYSIQPLAGARLKLWNHVSISLSGGYDFSFGGDLGGNRIDWSGFRVNTGLGYSF